MQCAEHQVSSEAGLNGDLRRFKIADFTHQNDVGILTQETSQQLGEGEFLIVIHLTLNQSGNVIFNGILGGEDFCAGVIQFVQCGVERGGFTAAGWTRDNHNSIWPVNETADFFKVVLAQANFIQTQLHVASIQYAHDHAFAEHGRQHRHAKVDWRVVQVQFNASVLRQAPFSDVQFGHDLHAADNGH